MTKENISKTFLLPGLEINEGLKTKFNTYGFVNTYLKCGKITYPYNVLFLLFKPYALDIEFNNFVVDLQKNRNFIEVLDLTDGRVVIVYRIPSRFDKDYQLFLDGKYSRLSKEFKACFAMEKLKLDNKGVPVRVHGQLIKEPTNFFHIFNKTEHWKEHLKTTYLLDDDIVNSMEELYERQNPERETLDIEEVW